MCIRLRVIELMRGKFLKKKKMIVISIIIDNIV